ncbi:hypothetical protein BN961_02169 [Afipia felis]|uniref:Uncharacterized protein n=1 Tax=Afipia felis TaxID=1035 RepID=A0A090MMZ6_AFIFE|nr:hypothetical protein [Afipia felis]CEG08751.1 hypothetical protein BN961_02169 [Afipia felis]
MSDFREMVHSITEEPSMSDPAVAIPARVTALINDLDDLASAALAPETREIVAGEFHSIEMIQTRAALILSFIQSMNVTPFRANGGGH